MPGSHYLSATTHTVALEQIRRLNVLLGQHPCEITAKSLGLDGRPVAARPTVTGRTLDGFPAPRLGASAGLLRITAYGDPEFPYLAGHFSLRRPRPGAAELDLRADAVSLQLHSDDLRKVSLHFGLRQVWGA